MIVGKFVVKNIYLRSLFFWYSRFVVHSNWNCCLIVVAFRFPNTTKPRPSSSSSEDHRFVQMAENASDRSFWRWICEIFHPKWSSCLPRLTQIDWTHEWFDFDSHVSHVHFLVSCCHLCPVNIPRQDWGGKFRKTEGGETFFRHRSQLSPPGPNPAAPPS